MKSSALLTGTAFAAAAVAQVLSIPEGTNLGTPSSIISTPLTNPLQTSTTHTGHASIPEGTSKPGTISIPDGTMSIPEGTSMGTISDTQGSSAPTATGSSSSTGGGGGTTLVPTTTTPPTGTGTTPASSSGGQSTSASTAGAVANQAAGAAAVAGVFAALLV
ncbi:oxysterol binding protein (Osh3) [Purpureocillium lavendulum]|uniref:Oxysterol binding protein (Osh3) n=1 Tax=Purpureocillium lavendulum TaxID=1247861 RepID=A0AB34FPS7_9HYPO|nr:oxysterol binding protein (Osh3) [Purpureocillium lavendulum]